MSVGAYVLAVCGGREHLDRARDAAARLTARTRRRIVLVTDPARNRAPLPALETIALPTDPALSDAQAAILLKTSVAELLPEGAVHFYLDSDLLAIAADIDEVFAAFSPPATFASDLPVPEATLRSFSSHAVDCPCAAERARLERFFARLDSLTRFHRERAELAALDDPALYRAPRFEGERRHGAWWRGTARGGSGDGAIRFEQVFEAGRPVTIRYRFDGTTWALERREGEPARFDDGAGPPFQWVADPAVADGGYWRDGDGDSFRRPLAAGAGAPERWWYRGDQPARRWVEDARRDAGGCWIDGDGAPLGECDHLAERLEARFGIAIADRRWVPWNGGAFLFGPGSRPLLADWRRRCLDLFAAPGFCSRDQGALIATAWAAGLERHPRLPGAFNRIVDRRSRAGAALRLADLEAEGARFLHLIGGGADDPGWPLGRDLAAAR